MRKNYINKFIKYLLLFMFIFIISSNSDTAFANLMNITGTWDSNWGKMVFEQTGNNVTGTYATSNGKIFGKLNGNILEGYWTQSSAGQKCSTQKYGSFFWGRIRFEFDQTNHFSGSWGYCEALPSSGGWSGTKQKNAVITGKNKNVYSVIAGTWDSNWGKMVFEQTGNNVTGTYATSNGKIFGKLNGNILEGYWTQSSAGQKCSTQKYGSFFWGRIRFVFDHQNNHFSGNWGYCENAPSSGGWSGTRK